MGLLSLSTSGLLLNKHTLHAMEGRRAGGVHRRGPGRGEVPFLSLALAALVFTGLFAYTAKAFSAVYIILQ